MRAEPVPDSNGTHCFAMYPPTRPGKARSPIPVRVVHGRDCRLPDVHLLSDTSQEWTSVPPEFWPSFGADSR